MYDIEFIYIYLGNQNTVWCLLFKAFHSNTEISNVLNHTYLDILLHVEVIIEVTTFCFIPTGKSTSRRSSWAPP